MDSPVLSVAVAEGLTSAKGMYIRVKKPIDSGYFNFVYGIYKESTKDGVCI